MVQSAKDGDPLAPVTVIAPSSHAVVSIRRSLGAGAGVGGRPGWANVGCTTVPGLVRALGLPALAARGLRPASPAVDIEVIRSEALAAGEWLADLARHPGAVAELQRTLGELRRCPPSTAQAVAAGPGLGADLVGLLRAVGRRLHRCGLADDADVAAAAGAAARRGGPASAALGPLVCWELGPLAPAERKVLHHLGARAPGTATGSRRPETTLTEVRTCTDPDEEAQSAVRSVLAAAEAGVPLWRQAVFHPPGPTYARILHQQLAAAGVATNGPDLRPLHRSMTGRALLGLLALAGGEWPRHDVLAWLSAAPVTVGPGGRPVPVTRWDTLSAAAGVVRGRQQWHDRLGRLAAGDDTEAGALAAFVDELTVRATPPRPSWEAYGAWAVDLLDHYLRPGSADPWPEAEEVAADQVRAILSSLADLDGVSDGCDLASFRSAVRRQLEGTALATHELAWGGVGDGVLLAPYGGARGLRFHAVVVTGLADALVPGSGGGDGLLGDEVRQLDRSGALATRATRRRELRADLTHSVASGSGRRTGTLPQGDPRSGRAHIPSRWLGALSGPGTHWHAVDSFAAGLAAAEPAATAREFELREMYRWLRRGGDPARSPAAADPRLVRGFQAARGRADTSFTRFDGYVGAGLVSPFDPGTPVSATRFETYAKCPRRYLLERVLRVSPRVRPEELWRIEPTTRGSLVHAILEEYVRARVDGAPRSLERLLVIARAHLDDAEAGGLVGRRLLWRMDRAAIVRDLTRFHAEEGDTEPVAAELSFGLDDGDAVAPVPVALDDGRTVAFRGSADRIDRTAAGRLMVSDYKTGRQSALNELTRDPVAGGKLLQLPLYAMAALTRFGGSAPVHARYWLLSAERSAPCYHLVVTPEVQARFRAVVGQIADGVENGCFPGVPGPPSYESFRNCAHCDFDRLCPASRDRQWGRTYNAPQLRGVISLVDGRAPDALAGAVVKRFVDPDEGAVE
jgi:RecB family exonuclease